MRAASLTGRMHPRSAPTAPTRWLRRLVGAAAAASFVGCVGARPELVSMPNDGEDPTELARCRVAASQEQPLVTEWPASYKARLEALLSGGAVAVEYSGCELRIVDRCELAGSYAWKKTTLSTDSTEIRDEDELYAKLPLGAALLSGDLKTKGSLRVQTTVSGHMQLVGREATDQTSGAECSRATHLVTALSVGAFRLEAGGEAQAGVGAELGPVEGRASTSQSRAVLRAAGEPDRCAQATDAEPDPGCRSPIQIFLSPIRRSVPLGVLSPLPSEGD